MVDSVQGLNEMTSLCADHSTHSSSTYQRSFTGSLSKVLFPKVRTESHYPRDLTAKKECLTPTSVFTRRSDLTNPSTTASSESDLDAQSVSDYFTSQQPRKKDVAFSSYCEDKISVSGSNNDFECNDYIAEDWQPGFTEKSRVTIDVVVRKRPSDDLVVHVNSSQPQKKPRLSETPASFDEDVLDLD